jgi:LysM repeat protein
MTLSTLAEHFRTSAKQSGSVTIDSATLQAAQLSPTQGLDALIARALEEPQLVLTTTEAQIGTATEEMLTITGSLKAPRVEADLVTVVFKAAGSLVTFTLDAPLPAGWSLTKSFATLAGFPFDALALTKPSYVFSTSAVKHYEGSSGAFDLQPGLNFATLAALGKALAPLLALAPGASSPVLLSGTIDPGAMTKAWQKPAVALGAALLEGPLPKLGILELAEADLGLDVVSETTLEGESAQYTYAYMLAKLIVGKSPELKCRISVRGNSPTLSLLVSPDPKHPLTIEDVFALMGGRSWFSEIPSPLQSVLTSVGFKGFEAVISTGGNETSLDSIAVTVGSTSPWPLFDEWRIDNVDFTWTVLDPGGDPQVFGMFGGTAHFFPTVFTDQFYVTVTTDLQIDAGYNGILKLSTLLEKFAPGTVLPDHMDVELGDFGVSIDKPRSAFAVAATAGMSMDVLGTGALMMAQAQLMFAKAPGSTHAALEGSLAIGGTAFDLAAAYDQGAWSFHGELEPGDAIELGALVDDLLEKIGLPDFVPRTLEITPLQIAVEVPAQKDARGSYNLDAGTRWTLQKPGSVLNGLELSAEVKLDYDGAGNKHTGLIKGEAKLPLPEPLQGKTLDVGVGYELTADNELLWVDWHGFAEAKYSFPKDEIEFKLEAASLGSLLAELVGIVEGKPEFTLPAPWNLLNEISLKSFHVVWRLKDKENPLTVEYDFEGNNINLFFIEIESLGFGVKEKKIQITMSAKLLGETKFKKLDFPAEKPPAAPGQDTSKFELELLALGQRVSVEGLAEATKIDAAVKTLEKFNAPEEGKIPVPVKRTAGQPYYAPESSWLIGASFKVLVDKGTGAALLFLEGVFNDPQLYGLRVTLAGEKAGPLAGLDFEILYRKVSDTVGVYQIELTLPEAMRHIELGEVSVTLPVIGLDVYTNGNFRVDFGFPANMNFSRSAGLQAFPFMGQGGFYFGVLSSRTAGEQVPATKKGSFDPVIVFGIGLRVGLGKSISEGIFSAELSVTVFGIVEGVIAVFHPYTAQLGHNTAQLGQNTAPLALSAGSLGAQTTSASLEDQYYWWLRGTAGIIGVVEGTINFAIISASVNITVRALIQVTIEAHREIPVHVEAGVSVGVTVTIDLGLFSIHLHFSFSLTITADFVIGENTPAPWDEPHGLGAARAAAAELPAPTARTFAALTVEEKIPLTVYGAPHLTLADWTSGTNPQAAWVAMLYIEGPVGQQTSARAPTPFETLARETLLWAIANFGDSAPRDRAEALAATVTRAQVQSAFAHFAAQGGPPAVAWSDIRTFLSQQFSVSIVALSENIESVTALPMPPDLTLTVPGWEGKPGRTIDFSVEAMCGKEYLEALQKALDELAVDLETDLERKHASAPVAVRVGETPEQSLATFIAEDWFALLCRHMLQAALEAFDSYAYLLPEDLSPEAIVGRFPPSDTLTVAALAKANAGLPLSANASIAVEHVTHAVTATDTLATVASAYSLQPLQIAEANKELQGLLVTGAVLTVAGTAHTIEPRDTLHKIAEATSGHLSDVVAAIEQVKTPVLVPLAVLAIPPFTHKAAPDGGDTLASLAAVYGVTVESLGEANAKTSPFFELVTGKTLVDVPGCSALTAELLIEELHASQTYTNLAGISARFLLNGLRLPVSSAIRLDPHAVCASASSCGLQALIGQQVTLPTLAEADAEKYALTLARGAQGGWIELGTSGETLAMKAEKLQIEWLNKVLAAATPALKPQTLSIAALPATAGVARRFALTAALPLRLPAALALPTGNAAAPTLLSLPDGLLSVLAEQARARPAFSLQRTDPAPGGTTVVNPVAAYAWATLVPVTVARLAGAPAGAYELIGADQTGVVLLERLVEAIGLGAHPIYGAPQVLYTPAATDPQPNGLAGGNPATVSSFIVQANLSTDTNPPHSTVAGMARDLANMTVVANQPEELVRLLWECSIVASGGYYLHYESAPGSPGLPDYLFDAHGRATVQLLIQLAPSQGGLGSYANAAVLGEAIDPAHTTVLAQSEPRSLTHAMSADDSLESIAEGLHLTVSELAGQLADVPLKPNGPALKIEWALYETRSGDTLEKLAQRFDTTAAAIQAANPELQIDWSKLEPWTLLRLPAVTTSVAATGPATLRELAAAFSLSPEALGWLNRQVAGIFKVDGTPVGIADEILDATATLPPGAAGFQVQRKQIGSSSSEIAPQLSDPAAEYLDSSFHLLGWRLEENAGFKAGPEGLPIGPGEQLPSQEVARLRRERPTPQPAAGGAVLTYQQLFAAARNAKFNPLQTAPKGHVPPAAGNPYAGVGYAAQPQLQWRDLFGNRARTPLSDPALEPEGPANRPPVAVAYTDRLIGVSQWPSVAVHYTVTKGGGGPQIEVTLTFDPSRYLTGDANAKQFAEADRQTYAQVYYQLNQSAHDGTPHVAVELTSTLDGELPHALAGEALESFKGFALAAWQFLDSLLPSVTSGIAAPVPQDAKLAVPVAASNPEDIFELRVALAIVRDPRWVADASRDEDGVAQVLGEITPVAATEKNVTVSLLAFAEAFEGTYAAAPVLLKLAVGTAREEQADATGARRLWAVRTSSNLSAGIAAEVAGPAAYYAPPPLSTSLISRNEVHIRTFDPEHGLGPTPGEPHDFTNVDLDVWAREALAAIDGLLSPSTAVPAFVVDSLGGTSFLERLRTTKKQLAKAIAARVVNVLQAPSVSERAREDAREHWEQQLLVNLSAAYTADVAVQLPVRVHCDGEPPFAPPALYGHLSVSEAQAQLGSTSTFKTRARSGESFLTFMFTATHPTEQTMVEVQAAFAIDAIEHEIAPVPGIEGYEASSWLSFPLPFASLPLAKAELGDLKIPVVLRAYPTPPTLREQTVRADMDATSAATAVQTAARWTFLASYDQLHVAQDVIDAEAELNIPAETAKLAGTGEPEDLFAALARLLSVLPKLEEAFEADLATITTQTATSAPAFKRAANALAAFTELAERLAPQWPAAGVLPHKLLTAPAATTFAFAIGESQYQPPPLNTGALREAVEAEDELLVTVSSGDLPPHVPLPAIEIAGFEAVATAGGVRYRAKPNAPFLTWKAGELIPERTVAIGPIDGLGVQNARLGLQVTRNAELVAGNPTCKPFVYTTPLVRFPSVCTPLLSSPLAIDVAAVATGTPRRATLAEHLQTLFSTLLASAGEGTRKVKLQASYQLPMNGDPAVPAASLPIKLGPAIQFEVPGDWGAGGFLEKAAGALKEWIAECKPAADGALAFDVAAFSSLTGSTLPTVELSGLALALADITDV